MCVSEPPVCVLSLGVDSRNSSFFARLSSKKS